MTLNNFDDQHQWKFEASCLFSTKSAYRAFLVGSIPFDPWKRIWKSWVMFIWLAIRNRCWTADLLQKRGLPHPKLYPLCDQEDEMVQHILTTCVFAREFWFNILQPLNLSNLVPNRRTSSFAKWWRKSWRKCLKQQKKGFNSLVILGAWILWKHGNACVLDGSVPNVQGALQSSRDEAHLWQMDGAKGLSALGLGRTSG